MLASAIAFAVAAPATARAETPAATAAYTRVASWLFDLYLNQSIQLSAFNATRIRPGVEQVLAPRIPAMTRVLDRHRDGFVAAMQQPLRQHFSAPDAEAFAQRIGQSNLDLDDVTRGRLIEVDQVFRRDWQSVIRALTADLSVLIGEAMTTSTRPQLQ
jgi:hypothetical protein